MYNALLYYIMCIKYVLRIRKSKISFSHRHSSYEHVDARILVCAFYTAIMPEPYRYALRCTAIDYDIILYLYCCTVPIRVRNTIISRRVYVDKQLRGKYYE